MEFNFGSVYKTSRRNLLGLNQYEDTVMEYEPIPKPCLCRFHPKKKTFLTGLKNSMAVFKKFNEDLMSSTQRILLKGPQEGLVMTVMQEDCIVSWLGLVRSRKT